MRNYIYICNSRKTERHETQLDMVTGGTSAANTNIAFESTTENLICTDGWTPIIRFNQDNKIFLCAAITQKEPEVHNNSGFLFFWCLIFQKSIKTVLQFHRFYIFHFDLSIFANRVFIFRKLINHSKKMVPRTSIQICSFGIAWQARRIPALISVSLRCTLSILITGRSPSRTFTLHLPQFPCPPHGVGTETPFSRKSHSFFLTQPVQPWWSAACWARYRKPTRCTSPKNVKTIWTSESPFLLLHSQFYSPFERNSLSQTIATGSRRHSPLPVQSLQQQAE